MLSPPSSPWSDPGSGGERITGGAAGWQWHRFLWIAANELPLVDELIPFLLARSGQALDEFSRWVAPRRPLD
jgi:hypothetical protein